jgi:rhamnosyltransferase
MMRALIFTCYKPEADFIDKLNKLALVADLVVVVDNTPGCYKFILDSGNIIILQDGLNKGLGRALNLGILEAKKNGMEIAYLFDQDSAPSESLLLRLEEKLFELGGEKICIGPLHFDDGFETPKNMGALNFVDKDSLVTCLATSGMVFDLNSISENDLFNENNFFLDFVDFEWCWRLAKRGWIFYRVNSVLMPHRLGISQKSMFGFKYHVPAPYRHYFQFRDTLHLLSNANVPIYSKFRLGLILIPKLLLYPLILDNGFERLKWMIVGIFDYLQNVSGIGAAKARLSK